MTPWRVLPYGINYNTQSLKPQTVPKTWEDLLDPKWKKEFAMAHPGIHITTLQFVLNLEKLLGPKWLATVRVGRSRRRVWSGACPKRLNY
jgi:ABC-type Fe3+ transport system substrate-binding protein